MQVTVLVLLTYIVSLALALSENGPIVTLTNGLQLQGKSTVEGDSFRGIRYAQPPLGSLRWAPPVAYSPSESDKLSPVDATDYKSVCPQVKSMCTRQGCSEDCLYLNVFSSANNDTISSGGELLPVAIFVHGGAYKSGSSNLYPGGELVKFWEGKALLVTLNYRLNVFGFLGSEQLRGLDTTDGSTGNYGIQDQRAAFQWVQDNIASFGGDKSRVMIFGESAGAGSMSMHLTMPRSFGLYSRVILESGSFAQWSMNPMHHAQNVFENIVASTNCKPTDLACLQAMSTEDVVNAVAALPASGIDENDKYEPFAPTADGVEIKTHAWLVAQAGGCNEVPILHGTNTDEGSMFCSMDRASNQDDLFTYWKACGVQTQSDLEKLNSLYIKSNPSPIYPIDGVAEGTTKYWFAGERSLGDAIMSCPAKHLSIHVSSKQPVYMYHFEHIAKFESSEHDQSNLGLVTHASELPFVYHFNSFLLKRTDRKMADVMATYWGNFLISKNGNPNEKHVGKMDLPLWPLYTTDGDEVLALPDAKEVHTVAGLKKAECDYWIPFVQANIQADFPPAY